MSRGTAAGRRWRRQDGFIGGAEALIFGVLIFLGGSITVLNAWAVMDAKMAVTAAAREGARTAVDAPAGSEVADVLALVDVTTREALTAQGRDTGNLTGAPSVSGTLARCAPVTVEVAYRVRGIRGPWVGTFGGASIEVTGRHTEVVDPFRSGLPGEAGCAF